MTDEQKNNDHQPALTTQTTDPCNTPPVPATAPNPSQTFWLIKIVDDVKQNPLNHIILIGSAFSLLLSLCAWQYCRGYFKTLGINISYSHIDNLIFTFEQISRISLIKSDTSNAIPTYFLYSGAILILLVSIIKKYWDKIEPHLKSRPDSHLTNDSDYQYWAGVFSFYLLFIFISYVLNLPAQSLLSALLILCSVLLSVVFFIYDIWIKSSKKNSYRPILWLIYFLLPFNIFYQIGKADGERIVKNDYRILDTICLSKPAQELEPGSPSGFSICGKLVYSDSQQLCIKERLATHTHCRQKDKYEVTIISNIP